MNPILDAEVSVYAPASVGNIGPGFDTLGMAVTGMGDTISGRLCKDSSGDRIGSISGAWTPLPYDPLSNTASVAARCLLNRLGDRSVSLHLDIQKGVPGSGLGSSAASAVGGAFLAHVLLGSPFSEDEILEAAAHAEAQVSGGFFLDNVSASLLGGITVSSTSLRRSFRFGTLDGVHLVFLIPKALLKTSESRKAIPEKVPMAGAVGAISNAAGILTAVRLQDPDLFCRMVVDPLVQPYREPLIPHFDDLRRLSMQNGARAFIISGAGSTMLAITDRKDGRDALVNALSAHVGSAGLPVIVRPSSIDKEGVRRVAPAGL
jgi:homoserine kinase